jgi:hypothetical protein
MDDRTFPIHSSDRKTLPLAPQSIPFWIVEQHAAQAQSNHAQTVQRLAAQSERDCSVPARRAARDYDGSVILDGPENIRQRCDDRSRIDHPES